MAILTLLTVLLPLLSVCRRLRVSPGDGRLYRQAAGFLGGGILACMAAQELLLLLSGQLTWASALPLHLCSLMGLLALPALRMRDETLLHALLFAGMPGAALALVFPAVADTPWPRLTAFFFCLMHAGLVCAPLLALAGGWRPEPRGVWRAEGFLFLAALAAMAANALTGGNYLFLAGPVAGTPLVFLSRWGLSAYRLLLALLAFLLLTGEAGLLLLLTRKSRRRTRRA